MKDKIKTILRKFDLKILMFAILAIYTMIVILSYRGQILVIKDKYIDTYINDLMEENNYKVGLKINEKFSLLETVAKCMNEAGFDDESKLNGLLNVLSNNVDSKFTFMAYPDGKVIGNNEMSKNFMNEDYYIKSMTGERRISTVYENDDSEYLMFAVPVYDGDNIIASLQCGYDISVFSNLIDSSAFNKKGSTFVSQNDGLLITRPESIGNTTNLFKLLSSLTTSSEKTLTKLQTRLENGDSGIIQYNSGKHKRYICYSSIPECDWYSVSIVSASAVDPQTEKIIKANTLLSTEIITGFVIFILLALVFDKVIKKKIL